MSGLQDRASVVAHGDEFGHYLSGFKYLDQVTVDTYSIPDSEFTTPGMDMRIEAKARFIRAGSIL